MRRLALAVLAVLTLVSSPAALAQSIAAVRPSGPTIPANLLRFSIVFSSPPRDVSIQEFALEQTNGSPVVAPFDPLELWSPDGRILTILLQPGRVKMGLIAHDTFGRALVSGERITLAFRGHAIAAWRVTAPINNPLDPADWRVETPKSGVGEPITLDFGSAIDALDKDLVAVTDAFGRRVPGNATLALGETVWRFSPCHPWQPGLYSIVINPGLEDPAGNRVGQGFEHRPATAGTADTFNLKVRVY